MDSLIGKLFIIDERFEEYNRNPLSHPDYLSERAAFFSSSSNQIAFGNEIDEVFYERWEFFLTKQREEEKVRLKASFKVTNWLNSNKIMEPGISNSIKSSPDTSIYKEKVEAAKRAIKAKYLKYKDMPESHEDFAYFKERFRTNYQDNNVEPSSSNDRQWSLYWAHKMDESMDQELDTAKRRIWKEESNIKTSGTSKDRSCNDQPIDQESDPNASSLELAKIKIETVPGSTPGSALSQKLLQEYNSRVSQINVSVAKMFNEYKNDLSAYNEIQKEKEDFLKRKLQDRGALSKQLVYDISISETISFEKIFQNYWKNDRADVLMREAIDRAVGEETCALLTKFKTIVDRLEDSASAPVNEVARKRSLPLTVEKETQTKRQKVLTDNEK